MAKSYLKNSFFILLAFLVAIPSFSQDEEDFIHVFGTLKDYSTKKKLAGVTIDVTQNGKSFKQQVTTANGKFEFFLPLDHTYNIKCGKTKYISKNIDIDSRNVPDDVRRGGFSMNIDLDLFESVPDIDFSFLENPMGKANWDPATGSINWNYEYINSMKSEIDRLMKEYDKAKKDQDSEEESAEKEEEQRNLKFEGFMKEGGVLLANRKYADAVNKYEQAIAIKADNPTAKKKLAEAKKKLEEENALAESNKKYNEVLDKADDAYKAKNYKDAIGLYENALKIKSTEKYPKDQIAQAKLKLEEQEAEIAKEKEFNDLVARGDTQLGKNEFDGAINDYKKALAIKPLDKDIKSKIDEAQKQKQEYLANAEKEEEYQKIIGEADGFMASASYSDAISKYNAALRVKAKDVYSTEQITKAKQKQKELLENENAAKALAAKEAQFNEFMAEGEKNMTGKAFRLAVNNFEDALSLISDDSLALSKLAEAKKKLEEQESNMAQQEKYDAIIKTADKAFNSKSYENSLSRYKEAIAVIVTEYAENKIKEIEGILAEQKSKEESDKLAAAEKEKAEKEKAEKDRMFNDFISKGDASFSKRDFQLSINSYKDALGIYPSNSEAKVKLEKAEKGLNDANALLAESEKSKKEEEARLAELNRKKEEEAAKRKAAEEEARKRASENKNINDQYNSFISIADEQFADKNYDLSIDNYQSALNLKKGEKYPLSQIEKINRLKKVSEEEKEREARLAEERRKKEEESSRLRELTKTKFNSNLEEEAENYMASLREKRRKERIGRSLNEKKAWNESVNSFKETGNENRSQNSVQIEKLRNDISKRSEKGVDDQKEKASEIEELKSNISDLQKEQIENQKERRMNSLDKSKIYKEQKEELASRTFTALKENESDIAELRDKQFKIRDFGKQLQNSKIEDVEVDKKVYARNTLRYSEEGKKNIMDANFEIEQYKKNKSKTEHTKVIETSEMRSEEISREKEKVLSFNTQKTAEQNDRIKRSKSAFQNINKHNTGPSPDDYSRDPLADQYPQGITEDKSVENGKVILTRYLVVGNKVSVYKKIIGINQNYYFKNGVSCSEVTWDKESTVILE